MKVFAKLATVLGASTASPLFQNQLQGSSGMRMNQHSMNSIMKTSMGMPMEGQMTQSGGSDRRMDMNHQMSNMRDMYRDNKDMTSNMMGQEMSSNMRDMHRQNQVMGVNTPNQYFVKDDFGNYVYSYNDQQSEKSEEGNNQSIKGKYAYIMSNGVLRRVEYIADNDGFHIIRDNADPARIKRSVEADLIQTRMTSMMDSSALRDDTHDMYRMSNMMARDMPSNMDRNIMGMEQQRYSNMLGMNMMGQVSMDQNMLSQDTMGPKMMGRNIYNIMSNRGMTSDVSNMMDQQSQSNVMGRDMTLNMMSRNMMGQDRVSQMMGRNMLGRQEITPNKMYSNMMGQDMMDMSDNQMSSNIMNSRGMSSDILNSNSRNGLLGQRMMQKMEIERVPETYTSTRFF